MNSLVLSKEKLVKLLIQINCFNEAEHLHIVFNKIPAKIKGIDIIETLIIDDGSTDGTFDVAKELGATYVLRNHGNKGVPYSINKGLAFGIKIGADILVNLDADYQHDPNEIEKLVQPILERNADIVHGERPVKDVTHTSGLKKLFQVIGARAVSFSTGYKVHDASSGFRAVSRETMTKIDLIYDYASPLEYLIQASNKKLNVLFVEITPNPAVRPAKISKSPVKYALRSMIIILDNLIVYKSFTVFFNMGFLLLLIGMGGIFVRLILVENNSENFHLTLLITSTIFALAGFQLMFFALLTRVNRATRKICEDALSKFNSNKNN